MTTDYLSYGESMTVYEVLTDLRNKKPETDELYNLCVTREDDELIGTFGLRDLIIAEPGAKISQIMNNEPVFLTDEQKTGAVAEIVSKYDLLAVPVVDENHHLQGMVVIDDVVEDLIGERRTKRRR